MTTETIQGNKLIAEFMGILPDVYNPERYVHSKWPNTIFATPSEMLYQSSWDWLMPVVEKIESLEVDFGFGPVHFPVLIATDKVVIGEHYYSDFADVTKDQPKITATWLTVVDFIQWYNEQKINDISPHSRTTIT